MTVPLSVLLLQLRRQQRSRLWTVTLFGAGVLIGANGYVYSSEPSTGAVAGFMFLACWLAGGYTLYQETQKIHVTQNEIAIAQASLPFDNQPSIPQSNLAIWVGVLIALIGVGGSIAAAIISKG